METSVRGRIKSEGTADTDSQTNTITIVTAGRVGQTHVIQPVQQTSVRHSSINPVLHYLIVLCILYIFNSFCFQNLNINRQHKNAILCGTSPVHDDGSNNSINDDEHRLDYKDRNSSTVIVDNGHYIILESGKFNKMTIIILI